MEEEEGLVPAKPLSASQKEDSTRLRSLFTKWQARRRKSGEAWSQKHAASELGIGQSAFAQYLGGKIPLNASIVARFARLIDARPEAISISIAVAERERALQWGEQADASVNLLDPCVVIENLATLIERVPIALADEIAKALTVIAHAPDSVRARATLAGLLLGSSS